MSSGSPYYYGAGGGAPTRPAPGRRYFTYKPGNRPANAAGGAVPTPGPGQMVRFAKGKGYYLGPKLAVRKPGSSTAAVSNDPWSSFLSAIGGPAMSWGAVQKQAQQSVNDQIKLALADQRRAYNEARIQGEVEAQGARSAQDAIAAATAGDPAALQGAYLQAADRSRMYGQGLAGDVLASENANVDKSNAAIQALGAPGGPIAGYDTAALNNAGLMRNVVNPGMSLEDQAAAAFQLGQGMRSSSLGAANQGVLGVYQKLAELRGKYASGVSDIEGKRPTLLSQALNDAQNAWRQNMALYASALGSMGTAGNYQSLAGYRTAEEKRKIAEGKAKAKTAAEKAAWDRSKITHVLPDGSVAPGWIRNKQGNIVPDPAYAGTTAGGKAKVPSLHDYTAIGDKMRTGATKRLNIGNPLGTKPLRWSLPQIKNYLMNQWGKSFIAVYPGYRKQFMQSVVDPLAQSLFNQSHPKTR